MSRRRRNPVVSDMEGLLIIGAVGIGVYLIYQLWQGAKATAQAAAVAGKALYSGAQVVTAPITSGIAKAITLFDAPGVGSVPGNVLFPDGTAAPLSNYKIKVTQPPDGNVYVVDRGSTYQLGQSDSDGDWPATYVSG